MDNHVPNVNGQKKTKLKCCPSAGEVAAAGGKEAILTGKKKPRHRPIDLRQIPETIKQSNRIVLWKWEWRNSKSKGRRWTKVPYNPATGKRAKANDRSTWGSWENVDWLIRYNRCFLREFDGVGFFFHGEEAETGIDLDNCVDSATGELKPWAREIVDAIGSYAEYSPTGTGVKIILRGKKPAGYKCRVAIGDGEIEIYDRGRYFTVTGKRVQGTPAHVEERSAELAALCGRVLTTKTPKKKDQCDNPGTPKTRVRLDLTDEQLIDRARRNPKFAALYDHGDLSSYGNDHSRGDLALCSRLAYWLERDARRIDMAFRQSGLSRYKWDREDYRNRTIEKAIAGCGRTYADDLARWREEQDRKQKEAEESPPARPVTDEELDNYSTPMARRSRSRPRLPRRKPDMRQKHQYCHNLQTGLFCERRVEGDTGDIVLTHSCGKPRRCAPCASYDRDKRYGEYLYAVGLEPDETQLYLYITDDEQKWKNFRKSQCRAAQKSGQQVRRFVSYEGAPDGGTIYRAITPLPHPNATPVSRHEADAIVRVLCNELHSRGARRSTARCVEGWAQERPEPKLERLFRSIPDTLEIQKFLDAVGVRYNTVLSARGTIYRRLQLFYDTAAQRDAVRVWFHERDRQRKKSQSAVFPPDCDTKERPKGIDLHQFDADFVPEEPRRRWTG